LEPVPAARDNPPVVPEAFDHVRRAYEAANDGDVSSLVALFDPDTEWRGIERGFVFWRRAPS
jgi:ketosteroid isomerase-like protein